MAGWNSNDLLGPVTQKHAMCVRVDRRPAGEEDGIFEHGLDALPSSPTLLVDKHRGSNGSSLGVANDALEGAALFHDLPHVSDSVVCALVGGGDAATHEFSHRVLWSLALWKVSDAVQDIVFWFYFLVGLHEAVVWRLAEVVLEAWWWNGGTRAVDEMEGCRAIFSELFDDRSCSM